MFSVLELQVVVEIDSVSYICVVKTDLVLLLEKWNPVSVCLNYLDNRKTWQMHQD